jgi:uncharacterized protein DUF3859
VEIDVVTLQVPARVGFSFLIAFHVAQGAPSQTLTASVTHPPMGAQGRTVQSWPIAVGGGDTRAIGYGLEDSFEEVPGFWTFRVSRGDEVLLQRSAEFVRAADATEVNARCPGISPVS